MKQGTKNIAGTVRALIEPIVKELGYDLWDVEYVKEGSNYYLRVTIDKFAGIDINDCEKVHRAIDKPLDEADPIEGGYMLEVSSPGLERDLKYPAHFAAFLGEQIALKAFAPLDEAGGQKQLTGTLVSYDEKMLTMQIGETTYEIPTEKIAQVRTVYDFNVNVEESKQ